MSPGVCRDCNRYSDQCECRSRVLRQFNNLQPRSTLDTPPDFADEAPTDPDIDAEAKAGVLFAIDSMADAATRAILARPIAPLLCQYCGSEDIERWIKGPRCMNCKEFL